MIRTRVGTGAPAPRAAASAIKTRRASPWRASSALLASAWNEVEGDRVHAVALSGRGRTVGEDVAQVRVAAGAEHLGADHPVVAVGLGANPVRSDRGGEARPARAGVELGLRVEELVPAARAAVDPVGLRRVVPAGEGPLGALAAADLVLLGRGGPPPPRP